jgi:hypothetical protein
MLRVQSWELRVIRPVKSFPSLGTAAISISTLNPEHINGE